MSHPETYGRSNSQSDAHNKKLYYHRLGTTQSEDLLIYERPDDPAAGMDCDISDDGRWLIIYFVSSGAQSLYYKDLSEENSKILPLLEGSKSSYGFIGSVGANFYFRTTQDAPNRKVVSIDVGEEKKTWRDIIPEARETFRLVDIINGQLVINYLKDARDQVRIYDLDGKLIREVELPGIGSATGFLGKYSDPEAFLSRPETHLPR